MSNLRKNSLLIVATVLFFSLLTYITSTTADATEKPVYTVSPSSEPLNKNLMNYSTYNDYTEQYYMLRSYLEKLEKTGGGKLILEKGTYTITNALYVASNVTIEFNDGVKIIKGKKTGTSKMKPSKSIFQLVRPSKAREDDAYGKFNGEKNISLIGEGQVTIDMKYDLGAISIIMGHNQNVEISNLTFKNMYSGHFIELDASKNVVVENCTFDGSKKYEGYNKEAINIDTPDASTGGWSQIWSKFDAQPNFNVRMENNTFNKVDRAIGTHKYSGGKYHDHIIIRNNKISNTRSDAIRVMNWSNSVIENNTFTNINDGKVSLRGILASGAVNPTFQNNVFTNVNRPMQFMVWQNNGTGEDYEPIFNDLSEKNKKALEMNKGHNMKEFFIRISNEAFQNLLKPEKIYITEY
ncbi:right-handed parallel beta-helix repeat-containing protein [Viridibacillus sp. YIM B01967]|uniref:Right-handed parallel beta-helix repeat-containing protein n=1 Tax=Viridibacillus soli TaxID=2798301 RepID=A0ABS1H9I0_9BACL|nr:right-handed parallel beta-helix repeat-containing protein [Viridibacillus soli]MBK3496066.1 right-handed parallel beta-helix repeat-containing protein [Viridibacillus soli]